MKIITKSGRFDLVKYNMFAMLGDEGTKSSIAQDSPKS